MKELLMPTLFEKEKIACFTGHRPTKLGGYDEDNPTARQVKETLRQIISRAKEKGYTTFISGMALGIDQWAAEIVAEDPDLKLVAAIPCKGQQTRWPKSSIEKYEEILSKADSSYVLAEEYDPSVMQKRNEWMVDNSSLVIAVWDGTSGGTKNCIDYALKQGIKVIRFNPQTDEFGEIK